MIQKIRDAIALFQSNLGLFSLCVLTVWLPGSILLVYLRLFVFPETYGDDTFRIMAQEVRISNAVELVFGPFYVGAILCVAERWKRGLRSSYPAAMAQAARRSFKLLTTRIGTGLIVFVGCLAFVIPGILLAVRFALVDPIVVLDRLEGGQARNQSAAMTEGKRWELFGAFVLTLLGIIGALMVMFFVLEIPLAIIGKNLTINFTLNVVAECISNILLALPILVLFEYYTEAKRQRQELPPLEGRS